MNRYKVSKVEKLAQTVRKLEEAVLAGGDVANVEEKKVLDRELACAKISANRVAAVVANEWKDIGNKEKYQLRFKVLEERFKLSSRTGVSYAGSERTMSTGRAPRQSLGGVENLSRSSSSRFSSRNLLKNGIISSKVYDSSKLADLGDADEKDKTKPEDFVSGMFGEQKDQEEELLCHEKGIVALRAGKNSAKVIGTAYTVLPGPV
ncbi:microtubule-associated protein 70-2-like protein [Tanacetum coccineum]